MRVWLLSAVAVAGCGRLAFDPRSDAAVATDDAVPAACTSGVRVGGLGTGTATVRATDTGFAAAWIDVGTIQTVRLDRSGTPLGTPVTLGQVDSPGIHRPTLAARGSDVAVAWEDESLHLAIVDIDGTVVRTVDVAQQQQVPRGPAVVATPTGYALAWSDSRSGTPEIYLQRFDPTGLLVGGNMVVSEGVAMSRAPSIAWSGTEYLVSWEEQAPDGVRLRRIGADGLPADNEVTFGDFNASNPLVVWAGDRYAVTWLDDRTSSKQVMFATVALDGTVAPSAELTSITGWIVAHDLAWSGSGFEVGMGFEANVATDNGDSTLWLSADSSGAVLAPPSTIAPSFSSDSQFPSIAVRGTDVVIVGNETSSPDGPGVYAFCR